MNHWGARGPRASSEISEVDWGGGGRHVIVWCCEEVCFQGSSMSSSKRAGQNPSSQGRGKPSLSLEARPFPRMYFCKLIWEQQRLSQEREIYFSVEALGTRLALLILRGSKLEGNLEMPNFLKPREGKQLLPGHTASYGSQPDRLASKPILISLQHTPLWCGATVVIEEKSLENECFLKYHLQCIALRISHW